MSFRTHKNIYSGLVAHRQVDNPSRIQRQLYCCAAWVYLKLQHWGAKMVIINPPVSGHPKGAAPTSVKPRSLLERAINDTEEIFSPVVDDGTCLYVSVRVCTCLCSVRVCTLYVSVRVCTCLYVSGLCTCMYVSVLCTCLYVSVRVCTCLCSVRACTTVLRALYAVKLYNTKLPVLV